MWSLHVPRALARQALLCTLAGLALSACAPLPVYTTLPVEVRPSPSFDQRRPNYVILHHTSGSAAEGSLTTLTSATARVSAHYLIGRDGRIYYLVDERMRAWHAGASYWGGNRDLNSASIGVELDNNGDEPYGDAQIDALLALLADLKQRWKIPAGNFLAHGDVAPGRKVDPGPLFPWRRLAAQGFGLWCDPPYEPADAGTDDATLLAAVGYDVSRPHAAVAAFKRRYAPDDPAGPLSDEQRAMARCLIGRKTNLGD